MTLDEAVATIAIPQVDGTQSRLSQTGEPYVVIMSGGPKEECERCPALCASAETAVRLWLAAFNEYAAGKDGTVYWRTRPELGSWEIKEYPGGKLTIYAVYSRLLISNQPTHLKDHMAANSVGQN